MAAKVQAGTSTERPVKTTFLWIVTPERCTLDLREQTIHIRLAGVDAPEVQCHFPLCSFNACQIKSDRQRTSAIPHSLLLRSPFLG